ncbi:hypothetical protein [Thalassoroseus pseudoceratinae]|uniref:hypothetical protein n=1 Tax=Thalassoroseus pseudoceratinae TaxID=2713176 RepID=UPI00141FA04E|nr:hypothetical protein [Thalassoroseus pseudoceratinae]
MLNRSQMLGCFASVATVMMMAVNSVQAAEPIPPAMPAVGPIGNGYDYYREYPNQGYPPSAEAGHPNYDLPKKHYDVWYRPKLFGWTKSLRCAKKDTFRPRGFGRLFVEPDTPKRMDYHRAVLTQPVSGYGPSYYYRTPDQRCKCECCCEDCFSDSDGDGTCDRCEE